MAGKYFEELQVGHTFKHETGRTITEADNVFFSTLLHKEPNLLLAGGLVAFGGACMWKSAKLQYLWPITLGCLVAVATRPGTVSSTLMALPRHVKTRPIYWHAEGRPGEAAFTSVPD